ncbi:hypothetical protein N7456_003596 [Penicillium angulare]|uniref:Uncharacterized protein n=1 Tax=Penicillium angulare TaxID=116970 RepID=A0A9W9KIE0_9EURO|nr:hypothetical protein N7456_003596 [Penicillium angulare]
MAIWPFGRSNKNKRHTIQVTPEEAATLQSSLDQDPAPEPTLGRKPSLRPAKRQQSSINSNNNNNNNRLSRNGDASDPIPSLGRSSSQRQRPMSLIDHRSSQMSSDRVDPDGPQRPLSRTESLMRAKVQNGPNKLRRRLSKRKAHEIMREREIRMLSSTPIDIPRRIGHPGEYNMMDQRRRANGRRMDRYNSDISLSIRDSAASSMSDLNDPYTFKVNAFAALTPRPVVRYVEAPRVPTARSNNPASGRPDKDRLQTLPQSEEDLYHSKRRMNELADSLDASTLRELMERDRRRREKKQIDDQEKLRRKLQERADAQQAEEERLAQEAVAAAAAEAEAAAAAAAAQESAMAIDDQQQSTNEEAKVDSPIEEEARGESKGSDAICDESIDERSARVIGNIDDSSIRERKLAARPSFAPSHEMGMSRTTLSPSHSSLRQGISSPTHSQTFGMGSNSDLSERRLSDTSGRRGNTISSLFRRGSSRLKRRYRERFQESSPEVSNASHESFYRIQTQSSPPPTATIIPPRTFIPTGTVKRSQSKFTEHFDFGDEPMSPPDSRLQSPDIPEEPAESSKILDEDTFPQGPTPSASMDIINPRRRHHQSWTESIDECDNVPLSQSLASIDSEGSWMSGQFFRRMNQNPGSPVRPNFSSFGPGTTDAPADVPDEARNSIDSRGAASNVMGEPEMETDLAGPDAGKPAEMWHSEVGRRPVVVNPVSRPKSNQGALRVIPSLSPISAEEDYSPVSPLEEEDEGEEEHHLPHRVVSVHGIIDHV